jgi:hypothetical protein
LDRVRAEGSLGSARVRFFEDFDALEPERFVFGMVRAMHGEAKNILGI